MSLLSKKIIKIKESETIFALSLSVIRYCYISYILLHIFLIQTNLLIYCNFYIEFIIMIYYYLFYFFDNNQLFLSMIDHPLNRKLNDNFFLIKEYQPQNTLTFSSDQRRQTFVFLIIHELGYKSFHHF